jgi:hypothetical protein
MLHEEAHKEKDVEFFHPLSPKVLYQAREAFLYAIAAWDKTVSLELHLFSLPDLACRPHGRLENVLFIRIIGKFRKKNHEQVIAHYLSLMPLLAAYFPYLDFSPITDDAEIFLTMTPFKVRNALAIVRFEEHIPLSTVVERPLISGFNHLSLKKEILPNSVSHCRPWIPSMDDGSKLMNLLMLQLDPYKIIFRLRPCIIDQAVLNRLDSVIKMCEIFLSGSRDNQVVLHRQVNLIRDVSVQQVGLLIDACLDMGVILLAPHAIDTALANVVGRAVSDSRSSVNGDVFRGGFSLREINVKQASSADFFPENEPFTICEAAGAFRMPIPPLDEQTGMPLKRFRTTLAHLPSSNSKDADAIDLFLNEHQGMKQPVFCNTEDRMRHTFIIGQTGTGKSTLMQKMILQDIRAGKGLAVIDPHGDLVDDILQRMPKDRSEDVILFDLLDRERPLGFNVLAWDTIEERDLIIDSLYETVHKIYDLKTSGGPIFEQYFRGMLKLLMMERPNEDFIPTLLEFSQCFLNKDFRTWLKQSVTDQVTMDFIEEMEKATGDVRIESISPYITSKFSRFLNDHTLKMIVGQQKTSFDFSDVMNEGKLLFVKLGKGRFG